MVEAIVYDSVIRKTRKKNSPKAGFALDGQKSDFTVSLGTKLKSSPKQQEITLTRSGFFNKRNSLKAFIVIALSYGTIPFAKFLSVRQN